MLEQTLMDRLELGGGTADPVRQGRAVELDPLPGVDLALPVERQVVGVLADQDVSHESFRGQPTLDQPRRCRHLHHRTLTSPAAVLGPAGDDHLELRRDDVEALGDVLADPVHPTATARTALAVGLDHDLFARQMLGQGAAIDTTLPCARRFQRRVHLLRLGLALGQRLLDVLERQLELIGVGGLLGAAAEQGPSEFFDERPQLLVLTGQLGGCGPLGEQQGVERRDVVGQWNGRVRREAHGPREPHRMRPVIY